jgi:hypothetical protein
MQNKLQTGVIVVRLVVAKDASALLVQRPVGHKLVNRSTGLKRWIQLQERLRPKRSGV